MLWEKLNLFCFVSAKTSHISPAVLWMLQPYASIVREGVRTECIFFYRSTAVEAIAFEIVTLETVICILLTQFI